MPALLRLAGWPLFAGANFTPCPRRHSATFRCEGCSARQIRQRPGIGGSVFTDCAKTAAPGTASPLCIARNRRQSCYLCRAVHRHSRSVHRECLFMRICHPSRYRTGRVAACWTAACHALAFAMLAVTRCREATCNMAACSRTCSCACSVLSSLRGLDSCISATGMDIT